MALPTQQQLTQEEQVLKAKVQKLEAAYVQFLSEWEQIEKESSHVQKHITRIIDAKKINDIATHIAQLPS